MNSIKKLLATEYIEPLREGGSLPAIVKADDDQIYVMKFVGAGQGVKALIAELISGEIGRELGFNVPEIVLLELDPAIGQAEPDAEIQDLLKASAGINLGMKFLSHATTFNLLAIPHPSPEFASRLVWFDAFITNVDRTPRNVNMLIHKEDIWLIDHGASLNFHHNWQDPFKQSETPFPFIKNHVLLPLADKIQNLNGQFMGRLNHTFFEAVVAQIPDEWLPPENKFDSSRSLRQAYVDYLVHRMEVSQIFVEEAVRARSQIL